MFLLRVFKLRPTRCSMTTPTIPTQPRKMSSVCFSPPGPTWSRLDEASQRLPSRAIWLYSRWSTWGPLLPESNTRKDGSLSHSSHWALYLWFQDSGDASGRLRQFLGGHEAIVSCLTAQFWEHNCCDYMQQYTTGRTPMHLKTGASRRGVTRSCVVVSWLRQTTWARRLLFCCSMLGRMNFMSYQMLSSYACLKRFLRLLGQIVDGISTLCKRLSRQCGCLRLDVTLRGGDWRQKICIFDGVIFLHKVKR